MNLLTTDFDDPLILLPPIAGGDGDDEGGEVITDAEPAGDEAGGDDSGEESPEEGAEGEETAEGDETEGDEGTPPGEEEPDGDGHPAGRAPQTIPYSRFQEMVVRAQTAERNLQLSLSRGGAVADNGHSQPQRPTRELPKEYGELDKGMGGYMRYYLDPLAEGLLSMREQITDFGDQAGFYRGPGRGLNEQQAQLVEQTRQALSQKLNQPVERSDALLFLRGHPKHGRLFVDRQAVANRELANGVTAARRVAGKLGGRGAVARRGGGTEPVDLNSLSRKDRIAYFERAMGNTPV